MKTSHLMRLVPWICFALALVGCSADYGANPDDLATGGATGATTLPANASTGGQAPSVGATGGSAAQGETGGTGQVIAATGGSAPVQLGTGGAAPTATGGQTSVPPDPCSAWKSATFCCGGKMGCVTGQECDTWFGNDNIQHYGCYSINQLNCLMAGSSCTRVGLGTS